MRGVFGSHWGERKGESFCRQPRRRVYVLQKGEAEKGGATDSRGGGGFMM